jgi:ribosomal-protein-alanine N-acetyltransferase
MAKPHIRWMIRRDLPEVLEIENESFECVWNEQDFINVLQTTNCIGMVAEIGDKIVGYMIYKLHQRSLELINFAVAPSHRRRAIGSSMVNKLVSKLSLNRRKRISLNIRESNLVGQKFFKSMKSKAVNILRNFYENTNEDAYVFVYKFANPVKDEMIEINQEVNT